MNILLVSHDGLVHGGAGLALINLIDSLKEFEDISPIVLIPKNTNELEEYLKRENINYIKLEIHWWAFVDRKSTIKNIYNYFKLYLNQMKMILDIIKLRKEIKKYKIDVIHSNSSVINIGGIISRIFKIPHIWHVREFGEEHLNLKFILGPKNTRKVMDILSDKVIVISEALKKKYLKYIPKEKIIRVYDGIPTSYENKFKKRESSNLNILISGAIQSGKGQLEAIKAVNLLLEKKMKIKLIVAGGIAEKGYFSEIKKFIKNNNIENNIEFLGQHNDMNGLRSTVDLEVVCSYMEGFGRVTVEAMFSNLPLIVSNSGANTELVSDGLNGYVYKYGDYYDLSNKIEELYINSDIRIRMGKTGFEIAKHNFTQEINSRRIYMLYKEIIDKR